jgi:predicted nucleic acid-binding protein
MKYVDASAVLRVLLQSVRALDAIHVATAEILLAEANGEPLEFWTHDNRQATAALLRGLTVRGV